MKSILPLFPLQIVVYPNEKVPLHIFEDRYKQLVNDCEETGVSFGIPCVIDEKMSLGTEVVLIKIAKRYDNGSSDVICLGKRIFKIENFHNPLNDKLYAGGDVQFFENINDSVISAKEKTIVLIKEFYHVLELEIPTINAANFLSYHLAHRLGFSLKQEYEMLQLLYESERLLYIQEHLKIIIPIIKEVNQSKETIKLNGSFRSYDPMDFKDIKW